MRRPKQRKAQTYPLTAKVGNALLRYLKEVRTLCAHREVLLALGRPYRPVSLGALSTMTRKLQKRLGLKLIGETQALRDVGNLGLGGIA